METNKIKTPQNIVNNTCSQCGQEWHKPACGPSHAMIFSELQQGLTIEKDYGRTRTPKTFHNT